jgi:nucleotide-binding universal stress UspA family protein
VFPGSTAERLLHGSPCSVAVVPKDYRNHADDAIRRIGVAYDDSDEARAALSAGVALARALGAELEVIGVIATETFAAPAYMGAMGVASLRADIERHVKDQVQGVVAALPPDITGQAVTPVGETADILAAQTKHLDILVMGSRGYGPLHAVLAGSVSGQVLRTAQCPVLVVPRGIEAPLDRLFAAATTTTA